MCLRCSPGLFRHSCGVVSCHTSSMAANPHLALTKNTSPTTLANERRAAQNRGVQGQSLGRPSQRAKSSAFQTAIRRWRNLRPTAMVPAAAPSGGGQRGPSMDGSTLGVFGLLRWTVGRDLCVPPLWHGLSIPSGVGAGIPDGPGKNTPRTRQGCRVLRNGHCTDDPRRPPLQGRRRGSWPLAGIAPSADGAGDDRGFRAVRGAGISPATAGDRGRRPLDPCDFLKKIE